MLEYIVLGGVRKAPGFNREGERDAKVQAYSTEASNVVPHRLVRDRHFTHDLDCHVETSSN